MNRKDGQSLYVKLGVGQAFLALLFSYLIAAPTAHGQTQEPAVLQNEAIVDYPQTVTFRLELAEGDAIADAVLTYQIGRDSCLQAGTQVPVDISGSSLEWTWVMNRSGNPPPGAQMWWEWTIIDQDGNEFTTPRQQLTFIDDRFDWRTVEARGDGSSGTIQLHWYEGDAVGPLLLDAAVAGLDRLEQDIGIELQGDVQLYIYESAAEMREAMLFVQDWTGGAAFSDYNTILIGVPPDLAETWGADTVRHELAHLVIGQFARSCVGGSRPTWLNEGLAVYAEGEPAEQVLEDIAAGVENDSFEPVRSLNGAFPARGDAATSAYSQSYSLVAYLLETYGQDKMRELLLFLAEGERYDAALEQVYGFNADGLELAWREAVGALPREIPPTPTPILAASIPTIVPLGAMPSTPIPEPTSVPMVATLPATPEPALGFEASEVPQNPPLGSIQADVEPTGTQQPGNEPAVKESSSRNCIFGLLPLLLLAGTVSIRGRKRQRRGVTR